MFLYLPLTTTYTIEGKDQKNDFDSIKERPYDGSGGNDRPAFTPCVYVVVTSTGAFSLS
nr:MAG TPA_asm: hypothetical protein [Caudoviricetes sp.]